MVGPVICVLGRDHACMIGMLAVRWIGTQRDIDEQRESDGKR